MATAGQQPPQPVPPTDVGRHLEEVAAREAKKFFGVLPNGIEPNRCGAGNDLGNGIGIEIKLMSQPVYSRVGTPIRMVSLDYGCRQGCGHRARAFHVIE